MKKLESKQLEMVKGGYLPLSTLCGIWMAIAIYSTTTAGRIGAIDSLYMYCG